MFSFVQCLIKTDMIDCRSWFYHVGGVDRGIVLTGGGAMLHGMDTLVEQKTGVSTLTVQDAMVVVAVGTGKYAETIARMDE